MDGSTGCDTVLLNGNVITVDNALPRAEAVAVSQGRFVRVGTDEAVRGPGGRWHPGDGSSRENGGSRFH